MASHRKIVSEVGGVPISWVANKHDFAPAVAKARKLNQHTSGGVPFIVHVPKLSPSYYVELGEATSILWCRKFSESDIETAIAELQLLGHNLLNIWRVRT